MKRLSYFILLVFVFAAGLLWPRQSAQDTAAGFSRMSSAPPVPAATTSRSAAQKLVERLTNDGWQSGTAEVFAAAAGDLAAILLQSPVALKRLAALGHVQGVAPFIGECPEAAPLLALSEEPEVLAQTLMQTRTSAEREALLSSCLVWPSDAASRDWALALQAQGPLIARLMEHATPEALREIVVIDRRTNLAAAKAYDKWLADCLAPGGSVGSALDTASRLQWIKTTGPALRTLLASNPVFAENLGKFWPALRASIATHWQTPGEPCWHHLPPSLWTFLAQRPQDGLALVEAQGPGVCQIFCGDKAPSPRVQGALAGAYIAKRKPLADFILLFAPHEDFQGVCQQTPFHLLEPACVYLTQLGNEADISARLANWNHEPARLEADVVPNALLETVPGGPIFSLADKLWNGRIASAGDYGRAIVSAYNLYSAWGSISDVWKIGREKGFDAAVQGAATEAAKEGTWTAGTVTATKLAGQLPKEAQQALGLQPPTPLTVPSVDVNGQIPQSGQAAANTAAQVQNSRGHTLLRTSPHRYVAELPQRTPGGTDRFYLSARDLSTAAASGNAAGHAWHRQLQSYSLWLLDQP